MPNVGTRGLKSVKGTLCKIAHEVPTLTGRKKYIRLFWLAGVEGRSKREGQQEV